MIRGPYSPLRPGGRRRDRETDRLIYDGQSNRHIRTVNLRGRGGATTATLALIVLQSRVVAVLVWNVVVIKIT